MHSNIRSWLIVAVDLLLLVCTGIIIFTVNQLDILVIIDKIVLLVVVCLFYHSLYFQRGKVLIIS